MLTPELQTASYNAIADALVEAVAENERLSAWIERTAKCEYLLKRNAGYHARRVCLEAQAILRGEQVPKEPT